MGAVLMTRAYLVEGQCETSINVQAVEHSQPQYTPHEVEVREMLLEWGTVEVTSTTTSYHN